MEVEEFRAVIKHFYLKKWTAAQIKAELGEVTASTLKTVYYWIEKGEDRFMATVFWDAQGIILIDYLQKGQTITGEYYATLLSRLHEKLRTERSKLT